MADMTEYRPTEGYDEGMVRVDDRGTVNGADGSAPRHWRFDFHGSAEEYFKIWIVNLFLSVITLSLYAPWAKVRRLRYFYGNTVLGNDRFDFTAVPGRILIGRIIALVVFSIYSVVSSLDPVYSWIAPALMMAVMPWLIRSTMRFRARYTKYGNSRFYFSATMGQSYWVMAKCAAVVLLSFGLLYPLALYWFKSYQINHLSLGSLRFDLKTGLGGFYAALLKPFLFALLMLVAAGVVLVGLGYVGQDAILPLIYLFLLAPYLLVFGFLVPLTQGYLFRAAWQNVQVGGSRVSTDLNPYRYAWIKLGNYLAAVFTLGLLLPWGAVRLYRYQAQSLHITLNDDPHDLMNQAQQDQGALGEELADVFDIDISL